VSRRFYLLLVMILGTVLTVGLFAVIAIARVSSEYTRLYLAVGRSVVQETALAAEASVLLDDRSALDKQLAAVQASHPYLRYLYIARGDKILAHTFADSFPRQLLDVPEAGPEEPPIRIVDAQHRKTYLLRAAVLDGRGGSVHAGLASEAIDDAEAEMRREVLLLCALVVVMGSGFSFWLSGHITATEQAMRLLTTDLTSRQADLEKEIAERAQGVLALSQSEARLRLFIEHAPAAIAMLDRDMRYIAVSKRWLTDYQIGNPDIIGKSHYEIFPEVPSAWKEIHQRCLAGAVEKCAEDRFERVDGSVDWVRWEIHPWRGDGGEIGGIIIFTEDISARKQSEEALLARARLAALTADVGVALTRGDTLRETLQACAEAVVRHLDTAFARIWTLNEAEQMLELQASAGLYTHIDGGHARVPVGKFKIGLIAQERKPHLTNQVVGDPRVGNQEWARQEGMVAFAGYPLLVDDHLVGVLATFARHALPETTLRTLGAMADSVALGISRTQVEQVATSAREEKFKAEAASQAKNEFLSRMSHELRTPLNAILGFGQLLEMNDLSVDQRECVEQISRGGKHLLGLINEVLEISRIEAGRMELSPEPVRVVDAFQEVLELVQPLGAQRQIEFHMDLAAAKDRYVLADYQKLKQVLLNLLSNAVKYNRLKGKVLLACEEGAGDRLRLTVSDTGGGIPPEKLERLFIPFDRLGAEQTGVEGSGLGLALSKSLVELMGGTLHVTSVVGQGSCFSIELARVHGGVEPLADTVVDMPLPSASAHARTVLYIEDNLDNLRLVQRILALRPGVQLLTAMQGSLGMELARQHRPDLILLDVHLPDLNGSVVLRGLKETGETQRIPVVVVSADATVRQIERLRDAGATDYLTKPIDVARFLGIIDAALAGKPPALEKDCCEAPAL
jgi:PAS domain S-box-containing protein